MEFKAKSKVKDIRHFQLEQRVEALEALLEKEKRINKKLTECSHRLISILSEHQELSLKYLRSGSETH